MTDRSSHRPTNLGSRRARLISACLAAVVAVATVAAAAPVAAQQGDDTVRIVARKHDDGRVEFALQQRTSDNTWAARQLPTRRFFPTTTATGRWLNSSPLTLDGAAGEIVVRITARKHDNGRIEFALQQRTGDNTWAARQLPTRRFFPTTTATGRWLNSSPLTLNTPAPEEEADAEADKVLERNYFANGRLESETIEGADGNIYMRSYGSTTGILLGEIIIRPDGSVTERRYYDYDTGLPNSLILQYIKITQADGSYTVTGYYIDGSLQTEKTVQADGSGISKSYYEDGSLKYDTTWDADGQGIAKHYNPDGSLKSEESFGG